MGDIVERLDAIEARLKAARLHGGADRDVLWHASNDLTFLVAKIRRLFDVLQHGDERHQQWLREAIDAHFANQPVPAPYGAGRAESAERARDEALRRVTVTDEMVERAMKAHAAAARRNYEACACIEEPMRTALDAALRGPT